MYAGREAGRVQGCAQLQRLGHHHLRLRPARLQRLDGARGLACDRQRHSVHSRVRHRRGGGGRRGHEGRRAGLRSQGGSDAAIRRRRARGPRNGRPRRADAHEGASRHFGAHGLGRHARCRRRARDQQPARHRDDQPRVRHARPSRASLRRSREGAFPAPRMGLESARRARRAAAGQLERRSCVCATSCGT